MAEENLLYEIRRINGRDLYLHLQIDEEDERQLRGALVGVRAS